MSSEGSDSTICNNIVFRDYVDVKIMYEMANLHGHLEVYVAHFPQYLVTDYYLKNLCVDETDDDVTKQLLSRQKIYKEVSGLSLEEMRAWEKRAIITMLPNIS
nr:transposase, MuDR, MULE transposase domain protein [Tanacetum cinerariifolium]